MSAQYAEKRKEKAVADYLNGISVVQITQNVGVSRSTIYTWIRKHKANGFLKTVSTHKEAMNLKQKLAKLQDIVSALKQVDCTTKASLHERLLAAELLYHGFQKSNRFVLDECTLAAAQGLGGVLLNTTKCEKNGNLQEYFKLYDAITVRRGMWNRMTEFSQGFQTRGFYPALSSFHDARRRLHDGESFFLTYDEAPKHNVIKTYSLCHIGIPLTTDRSAANGVILTGNIPDGYTDEELTAFFGKAVIMDADALRVLESRGLGHLAGVRWAGEASDAVMEHYNLEDPITDSLTDEFRDIRIAFFGQSAAILEPLDGSVRTISYLENYCGKRLGITSSLYRNELGGRVCVLGYGAFARVESPSRKLLMMRICDELTRYTMPVKVLDDCKAAVFIRSDESGTRSMVTFLNMSLDDTGDVRVAIRGASNIKLLAADGSETELAVKLQDGYAVASVPNTPAYDTRVLLAE